MNPVSRRKILVTRPEPHATQLCENINALNLGWEAIALPTIVFGPPKDENAFQQGCHKLAEQEVIIFTSPEAVAACQRVMQKLSFDRATIVAMGEGTARALQRLKVNNTIYPTLATSEGLLELDLFQQVQQKKIAIVRGEGGRELLTTTLIARGAEIFMLIAYDRLLPTLDMTKFQQGLAEHLYECIIVTSVTGALHLKTLFGQKSWALLRKIPLLTVSERIKILAEDLGFQTIWVASSMSNQAIIDTLQQKRNAK